jgi:outer membrane protein assembly factor BamC
MRLIAMEKIRLVAVLGSVLFMVTGCGFIQDRSSEYIGADVGKPILIPSTHSDLKVGARYPIPELENKRALSDSFELPKPPNATAALNTQPFMVETVGDQTWLRLYNSPGKVWSLLDFFWSDHGVDIERQQIQQGYVLTKPIEPGTSFHAALERTIPVTKPLALQAKLTQGVRRNTAELQVRVVEAGEYRAGLEWLKPDSKNVSTQKDILEMIGRFVTGDELQDRYSLLANDIGGASRVFLLEDEAGRGYLKLKLGFQRTWSELGKALDSAEVLVADLDQSEARYYISYLNEEALSAWFQTEEQKKLLKAERNFALVVSPAADSDEDEYEVRVEVLSETADPEVGAELLAIIFEHIS